MDWESGKRKLTGYLTKYRYFMMILLAGITILLLPSGAEEAPAPPAAAEIPADLQKQLEEILKEISGAGKVRLLLTEEAGSENIYQTDESAEQSHLDTVIVMNSQREELGLIRQVIAPRYRGAVVVCQGGDRPEVRLAVVNAVKSVTGLSSDRITVLKMK